MKMYLKGPDLVLRSEVIQSYAFGIKPSKVREKV